MHGIRRTSTLSRLAFTAVTGLFGCDSLCESFFYAHDGEEDGNVIIRRASPDRELIAFFTSVADATTEPEDPTVAPDGPSAEACGRETGEVLTYEVFIDVDRDCTEDDAATCAIETGDPFSELTVGDSFDANESVSFRGPLTSDDQRF